MILLTPSSLALRASSMATRMACAISGAGMMPSVCANSCAASKHLGLRHGDGLHQAEVYAWLTSGDMPW